MIRVALVSYFNTKPFSDGLEQAFGPHEMEYHFLSPADCAKAMHAGGCDVALLPVGSLLDFQGLDVLNHFCIGADGAVDSVFLFSDVPVQEVEELILDPHSRTSNGLARVLFSEHWKRPITVRTSSQRPLDLVKKHTAAVMIGDLAHAERGRFKFVYDLSHEWKIMTGLPFVFAVWVCKQGGLDSIGLRQFESALGSGWLQRKKSAEKWGATFGYTPKDAESYLTQRIQYLFDDAKHKAMDHFFKALKALPDL